MKSKMILAAGLLSLCAFAGVDSLLPRPQKVEPRDGFFTAKEDATSVYMKEMVDASLPKEGYRLSVSKEGIAVCSSDSVGPFYARQTLLQLAEKTADGWRYPCVEITDSPAYRWRGVLLDEGRHFFGKETVRKLLDLMARYKFNVFHWHLTEDQGWRLEIPGYPKLTECGAMRRRSPAHGAKLVHVDRKNFIYKSTEMNTEQYGPFFYKAADVREILAYAKERHIQVVPEIEMPDHALSALGSYPEFACFPEQIAAGAAADDWGIFRDVYCIGNDSTIRFLENVLDYVCELFPSQVIHIGGDECPRINWEKCPKCQARMKAEGLKKAGDLQAWLTRHMAEHLAKKGRRVMGWDEILAGDVPQSAIGQSWRLNNRNGAGTEHVSGSAGAMKGYDMVISPHSLTYYSNLQGLKEEPFPRDGGVIPLEKAYTFDPADGVPPEALPHILGGQCCLWGEYLWNYYDLAWRMWPRGFAMAEILWTAPKNRDFADFKRRAAIERSRLVRMGINCAPLE